MIVTNELPSLTELNELIDSIDFYPVRASELAELAVADGFSRPVAEFYRSFPADEPFPNRDDLASRTEQVLIMSQEEEEQPWEAVRSPQE